MELVAARLHDEDIEVLFRSHSDKIVAEPMDNGEFDRMIRFEEGEDKYYYCFKDEGCHIILIIVSCRKIVQILDLNQIRK
ncbi:MAG: DUF3877 family protein [Coprococcus sp.]